MDIKLKLFELALRQKILGKGIKGKSFTPQIVSYAVTRKCNLNCPHCHANAGKSEPDELSLREATRAIYEMADLGTEVIIFSGGEPLIRKNFVLKLTEYCSDLGIIPAILTNGTLLNGKTIEELKDAGILAIGIPLDFATPQRHDNFRGEFGTFNKAVRAIKACLNAGLMVIVTTMVLSDNFEEIPRLIDLLANIGVDQIVLYDFIQTGRGKNLGNITIDQHQHGRLLDLIYNVQAEKEIFFLVSGGDPLHPGLVLEMHRRDEIKPPDKPLRQFLIQSSVGCHAALHYFSFRPNGDVYPCPFLQISAGNFRKQSLSEIWYNSKLFNSLRNRGLLKGRCGKCRYKDGCGGCRARAYTLTGDYLGEDPNCPMELFAEKGVDPAAIECLSLCVG